MYHHSRYKYSTIRSHIKFLPLAVLSECFALLHSCWHGPPAGKVTSGLLLHYSKCIILCARLCVCVHAHLCLFTWTPEAGDPAWGIAAYIELRQQPIWQYYQTPSVEGMQNPYSIEIRGPCKIQATLVNESIHDDYWSTNDFWLCMDPGRWLTAEKCHFQFGGWAHFHLIL